MTVANGRYLGIDTRLVSIGEAKEQFPLLDESCFVGAMWNPLEGHLDPSGTTLAYAKAARKRGATVIEHNPVLELHPLPSGGWRVVAAQGTIECEHVINAGGLWARELGRMVGYEFPVLAMEHQYILTEDMPESHRVQRKNRQRGHPRR